MSSSGKSGNPTSPLHVNLELHHPEAVLDLLGIPIFATKAAGEGALPHGDIFYSRADRKVYAATT